MQRYEEGSEKKEVTTAFDGVSTIGTFVKTSSANASIEVSVFRDDLVLREVIQGRVFQQVLGFLCTELRLHRVCVQTCVVVGDGGSRGRYCVPL